MSEQAMPEIGGRRPMPVNVEAGKSYWWCACGRSKNEPFCDGSHKGTAFTPVEYKPDVAEEAWFCACKRSEKIRCAMEVIRSCRCRNRGR